jgi:dienelactone hydrolase
MDGVRTALALVFAFAAFDGAEAQTRAAIAATQARDLEFPAEPTRPEEIDRRMALLVPDGPGPFSAVVLMHQCAGLNPAIVQEAKELVARQHVVMLVDSLGPRDVKSVCYGPQNGVNLFRGLRDALQAADHLRNLPHVDRKRVAIAGSSWGGMISLMAASPTYRMWLGFPIPPSRVVAHYPGCFTIKPPQGTGFEVFNRDVDVPVLALLAARDTETPAVECERKFREANLSEAIDWHVYPDATHCWDCQQIDGLQKIDVRGNLVSYRYDAAVSRDALERTQSFLARPF